MSIIVDENTRLLIQGITGSEGSFHTQRCIAYGTRVVAGVTPGKGNSEHLGVPVFNTVERAVNETGANASLMFVPPAFAADGILEATEAGLPLIVCITEGIPVLDMVKVHRFLKEIHLAGSVGVVSRSGTLTYDVVSQLTGLGIGQTTCVGIGGDALPGSTFVDILQLFETDQDTRAVVLIGEIGGTMEQEAAQFISLGMTKPVVAFVAGVTAPRGKRMGHAGAIITGSAGKASEKMKALSQAGATIAPTPAEVGLTTKRILERV
jgi:succinyl-CoA synthetase alpha subunit